MKQILILNCDKNDHRFANQNNRGMTPTSTTPAALFLRPGNTEQLLLCLHSTMLTSRLILWSLLLHLSLAFAPAELSSKSPSRLQSPRFVGRVFDDAECVVPDSLPHVQRHYQTYLWRGHQINYRRHGAGPPILLIHGFGANANHFRNNIPALVEAGYTVYAIDLLGFGASDKPGNVDYSIDLFTELLRDFVTDMSSTESWVLAGNSMGGLLALSLANALPKARVKSIILFNCSPGMSVFRYGMVPPLLRPVLKAIQQYALGPFWGPRLFQSFCKPETLASILRYVYAGGSSNVDEELLSLLLSPAADPGATNVFLQILSGDAGPTPQALLRTLDCPILDLYGVYDPWCPPIKTANVDHRRVPAGHCPHDQCPTLVHEQMIPWLKQHQ